MISNRIVFYRNGVEGDGSDMTEEMEGTSMTVREVVQRMNIFKSMTAKTVGVMFNGEIIPVWAVANGYDNTFPCDKLFETCVFSAQKGQKTPANQQKNKTVMIVSF